MSVSETIENVFVSVILVSSDKNILMAEKFEKLHKFLSNSVTDFEIIVISNQSETQFQEPISNLMTTLPYVRLIRLAFEVDSEIAFFAGIENCIGDFIILFDFKQDPISVVLPILAICRTKADVVIGTAKRPKTLMLNIFQSNLSRLVSMIGYKLPKNSTSLRCLSRRAVIALTRGGRLHHSLLTRMTKIGYPIEEYPYEINSDVHKQTLKSSIHETAKLLIFNSSKPMRWISTAGCFLCIVLTMLTPIVAYSTVGLILSLCFLIFSSVFLLLGMQGEYIARLLNEKSEDFFYMVIEEKNSSVVPDETALNVSTSPMQENSK